MSGQSWTPAPRKGAIPLHPMTFGTVLARAFAALRHNPRVLFGFAVLVQFLVTAIATGVLVLVMLFIATRIATVPVSSPDYLPILIGSTALGGIAVLVMSLAAVGFTAVVQGLVAADVSYAALGRRASLPLLWRRMKPAFWRLFGYSLLQGLAGLVWMTVAFGIVVGLVMLTGAEGFAMIGVAVLVGLLVVILSTPLITWIATRLLVVPATLVLERARLGTALVRSWRLTRGRFWFAFGVAALIQVIMGVAVQVVAYPASILSGILTGLLAPTGAEGPTQVVTLVVANVVPQVLVLVVSAIALVVQGTGATLVYVDSRMRYEGLDQALIRYVDLSAQGTPDDVLGDPWEVDVTRAVSSAPPPRVTTPPPYPAQYAYPGAPHAYPAAPYSSQPPYAQAPTPPPYAQTPAQPQPAPPYAHTQPPAPEPAAAQVIPPATQSPWAPPGDSA